MIHSSVDPRQPIPLSFLPSGLHAAAGLSHSSGNGAALGAAPLFLDDHWPTAAARRNVRPGKGHHACKSSPTSLPHDPIHVALITPPSSPPQSTLPIALPPTCEPVSRAAAGPASQIACSQSSPIVPGAKAADAISHLSSPAPSPRPTPSLVASLPTSHRAVSFASNLVTQVIPTWSIDEYPDRADPTPPRRLKFAEAAQIMAFQSLMRRQHAMIAVDDEAKGYVHEKCVACKGFHASLSTRMDGWVVPSLEDMEEMGM